jgi:hypothetical protein
MIFLLILIIRSFSRKYYEQDPIHIYADALKPPTLVGNSYSFGNLPICVVKDVDESIYTLGQVLKGSIFSLTQYSAISHHNLSFVTPCTGSVALNKDDLKQLLHFARNRYYFNFFVDGLVSAVSLDGDIDIPYVLDNQDSYFLVNHYDFVIYFIDNEPDDGKSSISIAYFLVTPRSYNYSSDNIVSRTFPETPIILPDEEKIKAMDSPLNVYYTYYVSFVPMDNGIRIKLNNRYSLYRYHRMLYPLFFFFFFIIIFLKTFTTLSKVLFFPVFLRLCLFIMGIC